MDHVPKKYWTPSLPSSRLNLDFKGSSSDACGRPLRIAVTGVDGSFSEVLRVKVARRVLLALSRFGPRLRKVSVRLAEPVNALGGVDQRCRMRAWLQDRDDIHAEAINGGFEVAVARAAAQLAKQIHFALNNAGSDGTDARPGPGRRATLRPLPQKRPR
jgi:hypothetical protein